MGEDSADCLDPRNLHCDISCSALKFSSWNISDEIEYRVSNIGTLNLLQRRRCARSLTTNMEKWMDPRRWCHRHWSHEISEEELLRWIFGILSRDSETPGELNTILRTPSVSTEGAEVWKDAKLSSACTETEVLDSGHLPITVRKFGSSALC